MPALQVYLLYCCPGNGTLEIWKTVTLILVAVKSSLTLTHVLTFLTSLALSPPNPSVPVFTGESLSDSVGLFGKGRTRLVNGTASGLAWVNVLNRERESSAKWLSSTTKHPNSGTGFSQTAKLNPLSVTPKALTQYWLVMATLFKGYLF